MRVDFLNIFFIFIFFEDSEILWINSEKGENNDESNKTALDGDQSLGTISIRHCSREWKQ